MRSETEAPENAGRGAKYSVVGYLVIFFVLVIALVLLSYFVEGRRTSSSYALLRSEYQESLERHRDRLDELRGELDAQKEAAAALESSLAEESEAARALEKRAEDAEARAASLEKELEALRGELEALRAAVEQLQNTEEEE